MDNNINQTIIEKVAIKSVAIYKAIAMLPPPEIKDLWAENNYTKQTQNDLKLDAKDNCVTMKKTKTKSTPVDWKDITDPKLKRKMYLKDYNKAYGKAYYESNKDKINEYGKAYREANKDRIKKREKAYREANKDKRKEWSKNYYEVNKAKIQKQQQVYRQNNKDKVNEYAKSYRESNKDKTKTQQKAYREANKEKINKYDRNRAKTNIQYKLARNLRRRLRSAIKNNYKVGSAVKDLGCTIEELKSHLESKFQSGMTWDNYGYHGWHIDHIKPLANFDLTNREQLLEACHYTNLQPLWASDNLSKSDKINQ